MAPSSSDSVEPSSRMTLTARECANVDEPQVERCSPKHDTDHAAPLPDLPRQYAAFPSDFDTPLPPPMLLSVCTCSCSSLHHPSLRRPRPPPRRPSSQPRRAPTPGGFTIGQGTASPLAHSHCATSTASSPSLRTPSVTPTADTATAATSAPNPLPMPLSITCRLFLLFVFALCFVFANFATCLYLTSDLTHA